MSKSKRHIHKYHRVQLSFAKVWACALPDCYHYLPQHMEELVQGKNSFCWGCNDKIVLTPLNMTDDKPMCVDCKRKMYSEDTLDVDVVDVEDILRVKGID